MKKQLFALICISSLLFSCGGKKCAYPSVISQNGKDISLSIISQTKVGDHYEIITRGCYNNDSVGFKITIKDSIPAKTKVAKESFVDSAIQFSSTGVESDNLLKAITEVYKIGGDVPKFASKNILYPIYNQSFEPVDFSKNAYRLLAFSSGAGIHMELYFTLDFVNKQLVIVDQDKSMIGNFVAAMGGE